MAEEVLSTGVVILSLDESRADAQAQRFGDRLESVLSRAGDKAGKAMAQQITAAVRSISPVHIEAELDPGTVERGVARTGEHIRRAFENAGRDGGRALAAQVDEAIAGIKPVKVNFDPAQALAQTDRFAAQVETKLGRAGDRAGKAMARQITLAIRSISPVTVDVNFDSAGIEANAQQVSEQVKRGLARAGQEGGRAMAEQIVEAVRRVEPIKVKIALDTTRAERSVQQVADKIERALSKAGERGGRAIGFQVNRAVRSVSPVRIKVEPDLRAFTAALRRATGPNSLRLTVVPDVNRAAFEAAIQRVLTGIRVGVQVDAETGEFDAQLRSHHAPDIEIETKVDNDRLARALGSIGSAATKAAGAIPGLLKFGAVGIAAAGAAQSIIGLGAALAPAAGLLAAGPAVILGFVAASNALKLALSGVGEAFGAALTGDAEAFEKSLEGLSPAAQSAAREVRALKPAFDELKTSVQDAFFKPLEGQITATAKALAGPLQQGLSGITMKFGQAAASVLDFIASSEGVNNIQKVLAGTAGAFEGLGQAATDVVQGVLAVGASVSDAFGGRLATGIQGAASSFGSFLKNAADSGKAVGWVNGAISALSQLGSVLSNVGGILSGVFSAANSVGGGFLANLGLITGKFEAFVKSAQGQAAIGNIFSTLSTVAAQLGPILTAVVKQVGAIAPALAPLFSTIGPAIVNVINSLGPAIKNVLPGIQTLVTGLAAGFQQIAASGALASVGKAIGDLAAAIAPVLPVVGQLVAELGVALAPVLSAVAKAVEPVAKVLGDVLPQVLATLQGAFQALVPVLAPLLQLIGSALATAFQALAPVITAVAGALQQIFVAVAPLVAQLVAGLTPVITALAPLITTLVTALTPLITALIGALLPVLPPLVEAFLAVVNAVLPLVPVIGQLVTALAPLLITIISAIAPIIQFAAEIIKWETINIVVPIINSVVSVLLTIIDAVTNVITAVSDFVAKIVNFFLDLGSKVSSAVSGLVQGVANFFATMLQTVLNTVTGLVNSVVSFFGEMPGKVLNAISSLVSTVVNVVVDMKNKAVEAVKNFVVDAVNTMIELPGKIKSGLGDLGSLLVSAGGDLIRGMINGIKNVAGSLVNAAKDVVGDAIAGAKSLLGIKSPSRVFRKIGEQTGQGLVLGLESMSRKVGLASGAMAAAAVDPFTGLAVTGPQVDQGALRAITQPFGDNGRLGLDTFRSTRQTAGTGASRASGGASITNNFTINEVGDASATAERVLNRMALAAGAYL